jgi:hypothetical protein
VGIAVGANAWELVLPRPRLAHYEASDPCCNSTGNSNGFTTSNADYRRWRFGVTQAFRVTPDVAIVLQLQRDIVSSNLSLYAYTSNSVLVGPQIRF